MTRLLTANAITTFSLTIRKFKHSVLLLRIRGLLKTFRTHSQNSTHLKLITSIFILLTYQKVAPHAFPYLTMMALRILELHRVLKPTGSFYLHCDPTMSHYLKTVCDINIDVKNYRNEIVWKRNTAHND
ncbi:MAG: hypothetical protein U5J96_17675 [Ignavibacteriaceae bacterium]|nr:hypothetical protein [Ignavibacteriaceae bacterium]